MKRGNVIWIFSGGGNKAAYSCGSCKALSDLKFNRPDIIIASSGGAANAFYYISGQIDRAYEIWGNEISSKKILSGKRFWRMFDRDNLIEVFLRNANQLNLNKVKESKIKLLVGVTNDKSGKLEFKSSKDGTNLLLLLKATMSVPFFTGIFNNASVKIGSNKCIDSRISSRYELLLKKAQFMNPQQIIIFGNHISKKYNYLGNFWYSIWVLFKGLKNLNFAFIFNHFKELNSQKAFSCNNELLLSPKSDLKIAPWDNSKKSLRRLLKSGYRETYKKFTS